LAHKLNFLIDPQMRAAIVQCAPELKRAVLPRRREEFIKILRLPDPVLAFTELHDLGVLENILSGLDAIFKDPKKWTIFEAHLSRLKSCGIRFDDSTELLSGFMFAFLKAHYGEGSWNLNEIQDDERLQFFLREELGMFKQEQATFFKALQLISHLQRVDLYMRKGERRQQGFFRNEALPLAMKLAQIDYTVSGALLEFWKNQAQRFEGKHLPNETSEIQH
ncbi:MAG: poly(A) polymerase, partial [Pseudobdellovibrionaceae bacterium]